MRKEAWRVVSSYMGRFRLIFANCNPQKALNGWPVRINNIATSGTGYHPDRTTDWWSEKVIIIYNMYTCRHITMAM